MMSSKRSHKLLLLHFAIFCLLLLQENCTEANVILCKESERKTLLEFKQSLQAVDSSGNDVLSSWKSKECCGWVGVSCNNLTGYVEKLDFRSKFKDVAGTISSSLLKLHHLRLLDLSYNDFNGSVIPEFFGSLKKLRYLDLSNANFGGSIPSNLGNLSMLETFRLGGNGEGLFYRHNIGNMFTVGKLEWLSHLSFLRGLDLSFVSLSSADDWSQVINKLPFLEELSLSHCDLSSISPSFSFTNFSTSLTSLDLSGNSLTSSSIYPWLFNVSSNLVSLDLSMNQLKGPIPEAFGNMITMQELYLSHNQLEGEIFKSFGNMCSLAFLDMESNHLSTFGIVQNTSLSCTRYSLRELSLAHNQLKGNSVLNEITKLPSLSVLDLGYNLLNGTIKESIGQLPNLKVLRLAGNAFDNVVISEAHFSNLTKLRSLDLSYSYLTLKISSGWSPPFQLGFMLLCSCKIGPSFPIWLRTQTALVFLDISASEISDSLPDWFWNLVDSLVYLNMSFNQINGTLPHELRYKRHLDLSSNNFTGPLPMSLYSLWSLNLSKNKFTGSVSAICNIMEKWSLYLLDLSYNVFSREVPGCIAEFVRLKVLNLADNSLSGPVPSSLGSLASLEMLSLRGNKFSGELPSSLHNCKMLKFLDLSNNELSGEIPKWIGQSLSSLVFLSLRRNQFKGKMPHQLCGLKYVQILDLSLNNISGSLPSCFNNFTSMAQKLSLDQRIEHVFRKFFVIPFDPKYVDEALLTWKGTKQRYAKILGLLLAIDLSCNKLTGEIPEELTNLQQLIALNLSRNSLIGKIPQKIGQLRQLEVLDLSRNKFSSNIPTSLSELTFLSTLDLSYNYLSGKIPTGRQLQLFDPSSYSHNQGLCGPPVSPDCSMVEPPQVEHTREGEEDSINEFMKWFYTGTGLGFAVGFWGFCCVVFFKRSWRHSYYRFLDNTKDWLYVSFILMKTRLMKRIKALPTSCRRSG